MNSFFYGVQNNLTGANVENDCLGFFKVNLL